MRRPRPRIRALELYHATTGGEAALKRKYRDDAIRAHTTHVAPIQPAQDAVRVEAAE